jgi:glycosyltransferase involved in cell wall biosynthesis
VSIQKPRISVLVPTYNQAHFIAECIESIRSQHIDFPIEILVGDDASTDETAEVVQGIADIDNRITLYRWPINENGLRNITRLLEQARGEFVTILEGDDYWINHDHLALSLKSLEMKPHLNFVCANFYHVYEKDMSKVGLKPLSPKLIAFWEVAIGNFIQMGTLVFKKELYPNIPEAFMRLHTGDWPLLLYFLRTRQGLFLPHYAMAYRQHHQGIWSTQDQTIRYQKTVQDIKDLIASGFFNATQKFFLNTFQARLMLSLKLSKPIKYFNLIFLGMVYVFLYGLRRLKLSPLDKAS